jgi:serine/threonine protein phosphatase PrpC
MRGTSNLILDCALISDIGLKRKQNQDTGSVRPDLGLFVVADGMGGHQGGEIASQLCVETLIHTVETHPEEPDRALLDQAIQNANEAILKRAQEDSKLHGMGTTATALLIRGDTATLLQVGDSRGYFWNEDGIWQLTKDHSLVQEKLRAGLINREQVKSDEMKNVITRSVGYEPGLKADCFTIQVARGDGFLLCSDGVSGPVDDALMFEILEETRKNGLSLGEAAKRLIHTANSKSGDDNATVVLVKVL